MDKEIDLGMEMGKMAEQPAQVGGGKMYPRLHITGSESLDLPEEGTMEIEFKRISESERKNEDGSETYECCIEVRKILEVESEDEDEPKAPAKSDKSAEEALDALAAALGKKKEANGNGGY